MNRSWICGAALLGALGSACGVSKADYDAKVQEATAAKQEADAAKAQLAQLQQQQQNQPAPSGPQAPRSQ